MTLLSFFLSFFFYKECSSEGFFEGRLDSFGLINNDVFMTVQSIPKDLTFQTKISDSIWREHKNTVGISDFVEAII